MLTTVVAVSVYPRECGGTASCCNHRNLRIGLSPRVRGNPGRPTTNRNSVRSIPASAGEPGCWCPVCICPKVYPRECGRTGRSRNTNPGHRGLSPRVRGNPPLGLGRSLARRSIPASAGEPPLMTKGKMVDPVYPRECGGTCLARGPRFRDAGLSPRVRGNPDHHDGPRRGQRSIPASAGEPLRHRQTAGPPRVYPRECGGTPHSEAPFR